MFAAEATVMVVLPRVLPDRPSRLLESVVDAVLLTAVLAPVLWWLVVRPLRRPTACGPGSWSIYSPASRPTAGTGHLGLTGMRERAELLGGEPAVVSAPGRGTRVTATIPVGGGA